MCAGPNSLDIKTALYCHQGIYINNLTTGVFTDTIRSQINVHLKYNSKTKQDKKRNKENKQSQTELHTTEHYNPLHITGKLVRKKEKEPSETITENAEKYAFLNTRKQHHQTEQEIKNLQEDGKESIEYNNNNLLPPMQKLTETVNFLKKGRNVADALWSAHFS